MLRLTALAAMTAAACSSAGAAPAASGAAPAASGAAPAPSKPEPAAHPARWRALPAIAAAVTTAAAGDGTVVDAASAWGDPAAGCYAVWLDAHGPAAPAPALADQVLAGAAALAPADVVKPAGPDGELAFAFARPPYRGRIRARLGSGRISAVACFGNQREPQACDAACAGVLQGAR